MAGSTKPDRNRIAVALALPIIIAATQPAAAGNAPGMDGASPGERAAIAAVCETPRAAARTLCTTNQLEGLRLARKPDLSLATTAQRESIRETCPPTPLVAQQFACERAELRRAGLPVRDEPGAGPIGTGTLGAPALDGAPTAAPVFFSLEKWREQRPAMPAPHSGPALSPAALYELVAPSVYVVLASDHAIELAERVPHAQGSAVAITRSILLTNCHVLEGRPQIAISQHGKTVRAHVVYADPGGDRCFLRSDIPVHPVPGIERVDRLKLGDAVFSLGAPGGIEQTFEIGVISGFRTFEGVHFVQNTAPIARGSSGGGLFDDRGNLIGITSKMLQGSPNSFLSIAADDFWP
jgi:S1-C subfamily serine protease